MEQYLQTIVPEQFKDYFSGWESKTERLDIQGHLAEHVHFEMSPSGNIHLCATIDGIERKYVFNQQRAEFQEILKKGFNTMLDAEKLEYVASFLLQD